MKIAGSTERSSKLVVLWRDNSGGLQPDEFDEALEDMADGIRYADGSHMHRHKRHMCGRGFSDLGSYDGHHRSQE